MKKRKLINQIWHVRQHWRNITDIRNPLPNVQLAAVKSNIDAIVCIKKPCRAVQLYCIKREIYLYQLFDNPHPDTTAYKEFMEL